MAVNRTTALHAVTQAVRRRPLSLEARGQSQSIPRGVCGQSGTGTGFLRILHFSLIITISLIPYNHTSSFFKYNILSSISVNASQRVIPVCELLKKTQSKFL
jgi:hypothetical protein